MTAKPPAFQFYARDWLADAKVRQLRLDERGAYCDLLCVQWNEGSIPEDCDGAGQAIGVPLDTWPEWRSRIWPRVRLFFPHGRNPRLERYRQAQQDHHKKRSKAGKKGARNRWTQQDVHGRAKDLPLAKNSSASAIAIANTLLSEAATPPVENSPDELRARIGPAVRKLHHERDWQNRWMHWANRELKHGASIDELEAWTAGLVILRDRGDLGDWIKAGEPVTPRVYEMQPDLRSVAESAFHSEPGTRKRGNLARLRALAGEGE